MIYGKFVVVKTDLYIFSYIYQHFKICLPVGYINCLRIK